MDYNKYIVDWRNGSLDEEEYADSSKYAFSLLKMTQEFLASHIAYYEIDQEQLRSLEFLETMLEKIYLETSHIEMDFQEE